jgi:hypothetical protein
MATLVLIFVSMSFGATVGVLAAGLCFAAKDN